MKQPNTLSAQHVGLMGPPQSGAAKHKFNESLAVQPATWPGDPMLPEWCTAIGLLMRHRTDAYQGSRVITFEFVQCITASLDIQKFDGDLLSATQDDTVSVPQAAWMRYALGAYLAALNGDPTNASPKNKMFTNSALAKHVKTQWDNVVLTPGIANIPDEKARRRQNFPLPPPVAPSTLDNEALAQLDKAAKVVVTAVAGIRDDAALLPAMEELMFLLLSTFDAFGTHAGIPEIIDICKKLWNQPDLATLRTFIAEEPNEMPAGHPPNGWMRRS